MKTDILDKLNDLLKQATTERSHFYVAATVKETIEYIEELHFALEHNFKRMGTCPGCGITEIKFMGSMSTSGRWVCVKCGATI